MCEIIVNLGNRKEYIPYYSQWAAIQQAKKIGECADVVEAMVVSSETGEILIHYENQKCVWVDGIGEL